MVEKKRNKGGLKMSFTEIDDDGFKRRKLVELRQTAGKESALPVI